MNPTHQKLLNPFGFKLPSVRTMVLGLVVTLGTVVHAQERTPKVISSNLKNPCGIAIRPITGEVLVADTGRGRIIEVDKDRFEEVIVNFPIAEFELDRGIVLGPLSLAFRDRNSLMVGTGGSADGRDGIMFFDLGELGNEPFDASEDVVETLVLEENDDGPAEGDFSAMAREKKGVFVVTHNESQQGWVSRADFVANTTVNFRRLIPTNKLAKTPNPGGITISPDGFVVVAQMGKRDEPGDSELCFYSPAGELLDKFPTGLNDVVALAYGPRKGRLFALDFSWEDPSKGGLYKLVAVDSVEGCEAVLVAKLDRPTSMTFDQNGNLWVTVCGLQDRRQSLDTEFSEPGKVLMFQGLDK